MDTPHLFDDLPGGHPGEFEAACAQAIAGLTVMLELASAADWCETEDVLARFDGAIGVAREVDLVVARMGREIERRSEEEPAGGLARRCGHRSAADLMAARRGSTRAEALRLLTVGRLLEQAELAARSNGGTPEPTPEPTPGPTPDPTPTPTPAPTPTPSPTPTPTPPPPRFPHVASALANGDLSVECASQITSMLDSLEGKVDADVLDHAERTLVAKARGLAADRFARIVRQMKARLDPEGHERDLERMRQSRTLRIYENRAGMLVITGQLDPETGAPVKAAIDAIVSDDMRRSQESVGEDTRTTDQMRADALHRLARHALGCTATDLPLATVTVVVRIDEASLRDRLGQGELEGSAVPLTAATLRRMAADADIIPAVLGGRSELLDLGRRRRLFTRAQRLALGERDGGCAFCGAPPAWTEVHHIRWWGRDAGPTDLSNGVLLCRHCHSTVHSRQWEIRATAAEVWFVPPASVDPARVPRRGGRARFEAPRTRPA